MNIGSGERRDFSSRASDGVVYRTPDGRTILDFYSYAKGIRYSHLIDPKRKPTLMRLVRKLRELENNKSGKGE